MGEDDRELGIASLYGSSEEPTADDNVVSYAGLTLRLAEKAGKAATYLADALFNSALVTVEQIETGVLDIRNKRGVFLDPRTSNVLKG